MTQTDSTWSDPRGWRLWLIAGSLLIAGFLNDPPWKWYSPEQHFAAYGESFRVAMNLYREGEFANPFWSERTGPTAIVAPGYPFAQFLLLKLFGEGAAGWLAIRTLATAAQGFQFALMPWLARSLGFSTWTGVLAALFGIWVKAPREELWDNHFAGLAMLLLAGLMGRRDWRTGLMAGLAFLVQPIAALVYFPWAARTGRRWLLIGIPVLICAPWLVRTSAAIGGPAWVRDNLGLELYISFNDCAPYGIRASEALGCFPALHPNINGQEAIQIRALGEYKYNQQKFSVALRWIAAHPARTASLIGQRFWYYWFPSDSGWNGYGEQRKRFATLHLLTLLAFVGLWLAWRARLPSARLLTQWVVLFPAIYYLVQFETRYRFSFLWITYILAAFALQQLLKKARLAR
jgi:hypothetical protein